MNKIWLFFVFLMVQLHSQTIAISGKITDENNQPLENVTVSLLNSKDSNLINFTGTGKSGSFTLKIPAQKETSVLQINADRFQSYSQTYESISQNINLGVLKLKKEQTQTIDELKLTAAPIKLKKDTVEYNASYLKVKPDSKIDDLLKEIPGVEIDDDGKITVNGKPINKILINGKPFFDKNGKIALQSLPADIIKKIQITTSKTKEQELTKRTPISDSLTVNFNIDEKNNKGHLNNLMVGYGTNKRYEGTALLTRFKQQRNIALIAAINNINTSGFSVDSFFESGNRNKNANVNGRSINSGILKTTVLGINYADKIGESLDLEKFSLQYNDSQLETYSKTSRTTFLPAYKLDRNSLRNGNSDTQKLDFNSDASLKLSPTSNLIFSFDFSRNLVDNRTTSNATTLHDNALINSNFSSTKGHSNNNIFTPKIGFTKRFSKKGRSFSASFDNTFSENKSDNYNLQETLFYNAPNNNDYRNQRYQNQYTRNNFGIDMKFYEPISDSASVSLEMNYDNQNIKNQRKVNDFDTTNNQYSNYNSLLSNTLTQNNNSLKTKLAYNLNREKLNFRIGGNLEVSNLNLNSVYNLENINLNKHYVLPEYELFFQYKFSKTKTIRINNNSNYTIPTASVLNPYIDISNPLVSTQGNPNLKTTWQNITTINFTTFDIAKGINFFARLGFNYSDNDVVEFYYYDALGKQFNSYANMSGNKRLNISSSFTKTYKRNGNQLKLTPSFSANYSYRKGIVNGFEFSNDFYNLNPRLSITLILKDKMDIRPSYSYNYTFSHYTNYSLDKTRNSTQNLNLGLTNYFFDKTFFVDNDFRYSSNSNISSGYNRRSYFWNASINYQFFKKQMLLKFRVYDLLNQRQNSTRTIGDNFVEDKEELILRRYFMLSLVMKFNKIGASKTN